MVEEPKAEDVEPEVPKSEGIEVEPAGFENSELPEEEGAPKLKEEIDPLVPDDDERPKLNADFGASDVADDFDAAGLGGAKLNGLPSDDTSESNFGTKPPVAGVAVLDDEGGGSGGLKPAKLVGAVGIVKDGGAAGLGASGFFTNEAKDGSVLDFDWDLSSKSDLTETRNVMSCTAPAGSRSR